MALVLRLHHSNSIICIKELLYVSYHPNTCIISFTFYCLHYIICIIALAIHSLTNITKCWYDPIPAIQSLAIHSWSHSVLCSCNLRANCRHNPSCRISCSPDICCHPGQLKTYPQQLSTAINSRNHGWRAVCRSRGINLQSKGPALRYCRSWCIGWFGDDFFPIGDVWGWYSLHGRGHDRGRRMGILCW